MADQNLVLEVDCVTGIATTRSMTQEELDAQAASAAQAQADAVLRDTEVQAKVDARTSGIAHAISLGFTPAQAEAMFP